MDDFDAMEHLDSMKLNHRRTNPLYEGFKSALAIVGIGAIGLAVCTLFYGLAHALVVL